MDPNTLGELELNVEVLAGLVMEMRDGGPHIVSVAREVAERLSGDRKYPEKVRLLAEKVASVLRKCLGENCADDCYREVVAAVDALSGCVRSLLSGFEESPLPDQHMVPEPASERDAAGRLVALIEYGREVVDRLSKGLKSVADKLQRLGEAVRQKVSQESSKGLLISWLESLSRSLRPLLDENGIERSLTRVSDDLNSILEQVTGASGSRGAAQEEARRNESALTLSSSELGDFLAETLEYVDLAESLLLKMETAGADKGSIDELFRAFHNLKGMAGFAGLKDLESMAHQAESIVGRARNDLHEWNDQMSQRLLDHVDMIRANLSCMKEPAEVRHAESQTVEAKLPGEAGIRAEESSTGEHSENASREEFVRIRTERLDNLVDLVGELVIAESMVTREVEAMDLSHSTLATNVMHMAKIVRQLQEMSLNLRMVTLESLSARLARVARDTAHKLGKSVEFRFEGADTEVDRSVVEEIAPALVHMVRNAVDHGIEQREDRIRSGKSEVGNVVVRAWQESGSVVIAIEDDGAGLNVDRIAAKAAKLGIDTSSMCRDELLELIFRPGFSTAEVATEISGRGVGMDVVKKAIEKLRGRVDIDTEQGEGTVFTIRLPSSMAIIDGMVVKVGALSLVVPLFSIVEATRPDASAIQTVLGKGKMLSIRGQLVPIVSLGRLFGVEEQRDGIELVLVCSDGDKRCALVVDELVNEQQIVVKQLGPMFAGATAFSGATILGDGRVGLILDVAGVIRLATRA